MEPPLAGLHRRNLLREALAGVTLIAIAIPLNIGYAQIAGLPPTAGLYALIVPTIIYALVVSSRQVVASPDAAAAALVASSVGGLAVAGTAGYAALAMAQAIICGCLFLLLAFFKLGFLANFLSKPILVGFVGGLALDILVGQIAKMLGIPIDSGEGFVAKTIQLFVGLSEMNWISTAVAASSLAVLLLGRRIWPVVPWALAVLVLSTLVVQWGDLEAAGVAVLGDVPAGAPTLTWPILEWTAWLALIPSAIALTMITTAEGLLVSRAYGEKNGYQTRPNRDLLAFGLVNIAAGAQGSFSVGSSTSRTAAMDQAGARTQLPSIVLAVGTLLLLLFGTELLAGIPSPAIGAIVAVAIIPLLGFGEFPALWRLDRFEFLIGATCFVVTLFVGSIAGILFAFVLSLVNLARRAANPAIDVLSADGDDARPLVSDAPVAVTAPGLLVIRMSAPLFFANGDVFAQTVKSGIRALPENSVQHIVIDFEGVTDVDVTGASSYVSLKTWLENRGIAVALTRVRPIIQQRLRHFGMLTDEPVYATNRDAVRALGEQRCG